MTLPAACSAPAWIRLSFMRKYVMALTSRVRNLSRMFQFGDGIMSMIDCKIHVGKKEDPRGDRVVLTFE